MHTGTRLTADEDDLLQPEVLADPYPLYARLRERDGVHWNARLESWMLLRYADVLAAVNDHSRLASDRTRVFVSALPEAEHQRLGLFSRMRQLMFIFSDPPRHTRIRAQVNRALTPRMTAGMRGQVQAVADELLDAVADEGRMDAIRDFAAPLPAMVGARLLGLAPADAPALRTWTADIVAALSGGGLGLAETVRERGQDALAALIDHLSAAVRERRTHPGDDLLSGLVQAREAGGIVGDEELLATCTNILWAGVQSVVNLVGNGLLALLRHPDQLEKLRRRPEKVPSAVEEMLRYDSPIQFASRVASVDLELGGRRIAQGQRVFVGFGPANRDPREFPDPGRFDISRGSTHHLVFSHGIHFCPGASLARLEGEIAFRAILRRLPSLELETTELAWNPNMSFRGLASLPVSFGGALPSGSAP